MKELSFDATSFEEKLQVESKQVGNISETLDPGSGERNSESIFDGIISKLSAVIADENS